MAILPSVVSAAWLYRILCSSTDSIFATSSPLYLDIFEFGTNGGADGLRTDEALTGTVFG
jgi:hypothetical protein